MVSSALRRARSLKKNRSLPGRVFSWYLFYMGTLNFTKGQIRGTLGNQYGTARKSANVMSIKPVGPYHPAQVNTQCVRAFEALNRVSSAVASLCFPWLGLPAKNRMKHNVIASWLKPLVKDHVFNLANFEEIAPPDNSIFIDTWERNVKTGAFTLQMHTSAPVSRADGSLWFVFVLDATGRAIYRAAPSSQSLSTVIQTNPFQTGGFSLFAFRVEKRRTRYFYRGFVMLGGLLIDDGVLFTSRAPNPAGWQIDGERLIITDSSVQITGERMIISPA